MTDEQFITHSRGSFALLRWAPLVAVAALPFTFAHGPISAALFIGAVPIAAAWLASLLFTWRTRNHLWFGLGFIALLFGSRLVGAHGSEVPLSQFIQWFCYVIILAGTPLLFCRTRLFHFARLDEPNVA
jgi:hypothetical protein